MTHLLGPVAYGDTLCGRPWKTYPKVAWWAAEPERVDVCAPCRAAAVVAGLRLGEGLPGVVSMPAERAA